MGSYYLFVGSLTVFSLLVGWTFLSTRGRTLAKIIVATALVAVSLSMSVSMKTYLGYATDEKFPDESRYISSYLLPPTTKDQQAAIYVWLIPATTAEWSIWHPFNYLNNGLEPRVFKMPFTPGMEEAMADAEDKMKKGQIVKLRKKKGEAGSSKSGDYLESDEFEPPEVIGKDAENLIKE